MDLAVGTIPVMTEFVTEETSMVGTGLPLVCRKSTKKATVEGRWEEERKESRQEIFYKYSYLTLFP